MKKKLLMTLTLAVMLVLVGKVWGQTVLSNITFESSGGYTTSIPEFSDGGGDFFIRTNGSDISSSYVITNIQGSYYFTAQDIDGEGATLPVYLNINDIDISGYSNLQIKVYLAEDDDGSNQDWDADDYVHFDYDIDNSGAFSNLLWIESSGGTNTEPAIDTDYDGTGDGTALTSTFTQFTHDISGTGSIIDIRIGFDLNSGDEDIAIDNIEIVGTNGGNPIVVTPTFDPSAGTYYSTQNVTISTITENATIYYSTDGSDPDNTSTEYTDPISVSTATTIKAIAYADGYDPSYIATAVYNFPIEVADIATLRSGAQDGTVYKLTGEAILTFQTASRNAKYIQDATGAILIDDYPGNITTTYNIYDGITDIIGTLSSYSNMLQFIPTTDPGAATSSGNTVTPVEVTLNDLDNTYQAKLVKVVGVSNSETGDYVISHNYNISDPSGAGVLRTAYWDLNYIGTPISEIPQDVIGVILQYTSTMQLVPRSLSDFTRPITFNVDMSPIAETFTGVEVAGDFQDPIWSGNTMTLVSDNIYTYTTAATFNDGDAIQFKFRTPTSGGYDWEGGPDRTYTVVAGTNTYNAVWNVMIPAVVSWANLQYPGSGTINVGESYNVYGQAYAEGITSTVGATTNLNAWIGYNEINSDPSTWTNWVPASFNSQQGNNDEFVGDLGSSLPSGTYYYITRFKLGLGDYVYGGYSSGGGGIWDGTTYVSGVLNVLNTTTWTGNTDDEWATATNWDNGVPNATSNVIIPTGTTNYPTLSTAGECYNLTIQNDASLIGAENLTVSGTTTVERFVTGGKWHNIASPVDNATLNTLYSDTYNVWVDEYTESTDSWSSVTELTTPFPFGKGFNYWVQAAGRANLTVQFQGDLRTSDLTLNTTSTPALSYTDALKGYNFIGNPFSSALDWTHADWTKTNIDGSIWMYSNGAWITSNSIGEGGITNGIIPMGQGFFVMADAASPELTMPLTARVHNAVGYYAPENGGNENSTREATYQSAKFTISNSQSIDQTWVIFSNEATENYDNGWDTYKLFGDEDSPQLYLVENELELTIDALPILEDQTRIVNMSLKSGVSGDQTLNADLSNLENTEVILEDLKLETMQSLTDNPVYNFTAAYYQDPARFRVHFNRTITDIEENIGDKPIIYSNDDAIYIKCSGKLAESQMNVFVVDMFGRTVIQTKTAGSNLTRIPVNINNAYFIVKVISDGQVYTSKVFIK